MRLLFALLAVACAACGRSPPGPSPSGDASAAVDDAAVPCGAACARDLAVVPDLPPGADLAGVRALSFQAPASFPGPPDSLGVVDGPDRIVLGDFDGDGALDVAAEVFTPMKGTADGTIALFLGDGDGAFHRPFEVVDYGVDIIENLNAADLSGDGLADLVFRHTSNPPGAESVSLVYAASIDGHSFSISTLASCLTADSASCTDGQPGPGSAAVADVDGDGRLDVVDTGGTGNDAPVTSIDVYLNEASGFVRTGPTTIFSVNVGIGFTTLPVLADVDDDGRTDLLLPGEDLVWFLVGHGDGTFGSPESSTWSENGAIVKAADFNRDGLVDLLGVGHSSLIEALGLGDGTFVSEHTIAMQLPSNGSCAVADFNLDGNADVACGGTGSTITILLGSGSGVFASGVDVGAVANVGTVLAADLDDDGLPDLVFSADGALNVLLNSSH